VRKWYAIAVVGLLGVAACEPNTPPSPHGGSTPVTLAPVDPVVATVDGVDLTLSQLQKPLIEGYGLNVLLELVQLDLAQKKAANMHITISQQDVDEETRLTLVQFKKSVRQYTDSGKPTTQTSDDEAMSAEEAQQMLDNALGQEKLTRVDFNIAMRTNAYLRKIVAPTVLQGLTEDNIRLFFNMQYGEKAVVRAIVTRNLVDAQAALNEIRAGRDFGEVATRRTIWAKYARTGGELPPFTRQSQNSEIPSEVVQLTFALKKGQVSDPLQLDNMVWIIKLDDLLPPAHAKFEDYRNDMRTELAVNLTQRAMKLERQALGRAALDGLQIKDPVMDEQYRTIKESQLGKMRDAEQIRRQMDQQRPPATQPTSDPSTTQPWVAPIPAGTEPPATMPASAPATTPATAPATAPAAQ